MFVNTTAPGGRHGVKVAVQLADGAVPQEPLLGGSETPLQDGKDIGFKTFVTV